MATFDRSLPILKLPPAPKTYSQQDQDQFRRAMEQHWHPSIGLSGSGGTVDAFATVLLPIDNGSSVLADGMYVTAPITFAYNIVGYRLIEDCNTAGSIELMVSYATSDAFDTFTEISGTQRPQLISAKETQRTTLDGWTLTAGTSYSQLRATVVGDATNLTRVCLAIALERVDSATTSAATTSSTDVDTVTVWRDGAGAPSDATGNDGDYYLNDTTGDVYTRSGGHYTIVANIKGATGSTGAAGAAGSVWHDASGIPGAGLGANGDYYLDDATGNVYAKAAGAWSIVATILGPAGSAGSPGSVWYNGSGAPSAGLGINGDYYLDITNGDVYSKAAGTWTLIMNLESSGAQSVPTTLANGATYQVPADSQTLFALTMDVNGTLIVDGALVMVD